MENCRFIPFTGFCAWAIGLAFMSSCASTKIKIDKTPLARYFETNEVFRESHSGLLVFDPANDEVVFDYQAHKHFTPASNTKLLTWFASILMLGDSIPSLHYIDTGDTLYFTGTGDPTLLHQDFEYGKTLNFLANQDKKLVYAEKPMEDQRLGPGWAWDDYPYYFSPEKASFPIYGNMVRFFRDSTDSFISVIPTYFEDGLSVMHSEEISGYELKRDEYNNQFTINFGPNPGILKKTSPFIYFESLFTKLLSDTLRNPVSLIEKFPSDAFKTLYSVPTDSVIKKILTESDNFLAEQILLVISNQLGDTLSSKKSIDFILDNYLIELKDEINWVDGSGLSRYNQITPNALILVLKHIYSEIPIEKLFTMLPASGSTGTLKNSFASSDGYIHAKTGSMSHVYNLSGFLETKSGKTLLFSFMNNNFNVPSSVLKKEMERVLLVFVNDLK
jgi:D-alanyl-D-alanine carboxypeptidase/D-alanyl-D-alanine-endopeptidase (penicillin-binding protein 4)